MFVFQASLSILERIRARTDYWNVSRTSYARSMTRSQVRPIASYGPSGLHRYEATALRMSCSMDAMWGFSVFFALTSRRSRDPPRAE